MSKKQSELEELAQSWATAWSNTDPNDWVSLYSANATYTDHPFLVRRSKPPNLEQHFRIWKRSIPDFKMTVVDTFPFKDLGEGRTAFTFRTHNTGKFENDLPKRKAPEGGKKFWFLGVVDFVVDADGMIQNINEWYSTDFYEVESTDEYKTGNEGFDAKLAYPPYR